jgi:hypothetical protein
MDLHFVGRFGLGEFIQCQPYLGTKVLSGDQQLNQTEQQQEEQKQIPNQLKIL